MKIRKQQALLWGTTIIVVICGILINNYTINNKELRVGEIESFMNRIFATNLINSDFSYGPNCFDVTIGKNGVIENFGVLTVEDKKLEKIRFTKGQGYRNAGSGGQYAYVTQRGYVPYTDVELEVIESFVKRCIEEFTLIADIEQYGRLEIRLTTRVAEDTYKIIEPDSESSVYIYSNEEDSFTEMTGMLTVPAGYYRFRIYQLSKDEIALSKSPGMTIYKSFGR